MTIARSKFAVNEFLIMFLHILYRLSDDIHKFDDELGQGTVVETGDDPEGQPFQLAETSKIWRVARETLAARRQKLPENTGKEFKEWPLRWTDWRFLQ